MFIGTNTRWQNFRNRCVSDCRETPVNTTGSCNTPFSSNITECINKCKYTVFVVFEDGFEITWLNTAKCHGSAVGKSKSKYCRRNVRTKRYNTGVPTHLHACIKALLDDCITIMISGTEDVQRFFLVIFNDHLGNLFIGSRTDHCSKSRGRTINKFNASFSQDGVVCCTHPEFAVFNVRVFLGNVEIGFIEIS